MVIMKAGKCPTDSLSLTNRVVVHSNDHQNVLMGQKHALVSTTTGRFLFTLEKNDSISQGKLQASSTGCPKKYIHILLAYNFEMGAMCTLYWYKFQLLPNIQIASSYNKFTPS